MPFSRKLPNPGIKPTSLMCPALTGGFFTASMTWKAQGIISLIFFFFFVLFQGSQSSAADFQYLITVVYFIYLRQRT